MKLLDLLEVLSPEIILVVYEDGEIFISGYTVDYVKQQADFFDTIGDDSYKNLQVMGIDILDCRDFRALYVYC